MNLYFIKNKNKTLHVSLLIIRLEVVMVNTFWYIPLYVFVRHVSVVRLALSACVAANFASLSLMV
jgi:hypothetical protein